MKQILLTFDVEEFNVPLEYGQKISFEKQVEISTLGLQNLLSVIEKHDVRCTFFTTAKYALEQPELLKIIARTHEVASHGYAHSSFTNSDLLKSKETLEALLDTDIQGFRMARLAAVDDAEIVKAGYKYNSSLNPTWIPGRYFHFFEPREPFIANHIIQIPTSVSPIIRIPLFWLSFENFPMWFLKWLMVRTLHYDGILSLYFHPWEFTDISGFKIPGYIKKSCGEIMLRRLEETINLLRSINNTEFTTIKDYINDNFNTNPHEIRH